MPACDETIIIIFIFIAILATGAASIYLVKIVKMQAILKLNTVFVATKHICLTSINFPTSLGNLCFAGYFTCYPLC